MFSSIVRLCSMKITNLFLTSLIKPSFWVSSLHHGHYGQYSRHPTSYDPPAEVCQHYRQTMMKAWVSRLFLFSACSLHGSHLTARLVSPNKLAQATSELIPTLLPRPLCSRSPCSSQPLQTYCGLLFTCCSGMFFPSFATQFCSSPLDFCSKVSLRLLYVLSHLSACCLMKCITIVYTIFFNIYCSIFDKMISAAAVVCFIHCYMPHTQSLV